MKDKNALFFDKSCDDHKDCGWAAALWSSEEDQIGRFILLTKIFNRAFVPENFSVLDVGCGQGDLCGFLKNRGAECGYLGIDVSPKMIESAKNKYPDEDFILSNFQTHDFGDYKFGYVICNGMFSLKINDQLDVVKDCISKMYDLTDVAMSINFLSNKASNEQKFDQYFYYEPTDILKHCFKLTKSVNLKHSYCDHEFMVTLHK